jgi:hypothetical protein
MTPLLLTRVVVIASTVLVALVEGYLATPYSPTIFKVAVAGFLLLLVAGARYRTIAMPLLMASLYLMPAILMIVNGGEDFSLDTVWILPLLGLILSGRGALQWSLPARWQWPLITWAMIVSITWPIVWLREADFAPWILPLERVSNTSVGMSPWTVTLNISYFALGINAGILLIDALFRWYAGERERFRSEVLKPLAIAAAVCCLVALYQGFFDLTFLMRGFWTYMIRASGTMADPNKLGALTAFWTVGAIIFARRLPQPWSLVVASAGLILGVAAVWLSGSRTGLAAVGLSLAIAAVEALRHWRATRSTTRIDMRRAAIAGVGLVVVAAAMVFALQKASTHTIVQRGTLGYLPFIGDRGVLNSANELLWERFGYGPAAIEMVKEHPIEGIGVGAFHALVLDYGTTAGYTISSDNAQSWLRHNIAEFGLLGSIPILWWCVVLAMALFAKAPGGDRLTLGMLRGVLIGFAVASMFGMPAQSIAIAMTFWVFVFWFVSEQGVEFSGAAVPLHRPVWVAAAALLIAVHAGATIVNATGDLRPRERAQRWNWYYRYGFVQPDDVEKDPGGNPIGRRWTQKQSLAVIPVKGRVLKFVAWIDHPDADTNPVHTQVWADSVMVYEGDLRRTPLFLDIPATPGKRFMVLETKIDRLWRPSDSGGRDRRELGLSVRDWVWE